MNLIEMLWFCQVLGQFPRVNSLGQLLFSGLGRYCCFGLFDQCCSLAVQAGYLSMCMIIVIIYVLYLAKLNQVNSVHIETTQYPDITNISHLGKQPVETDYSNELKLTSMPRVQQVSRAWFGAQAHSWPKLQPMTKPSP